MKSITIEDPRLTAYALGELEEPERTLVEQALAEDESLKRYVEDLRALGVSLKEEFATEPVPAMRDEAIAFTRTPATPASSTRRRTWIMELTTLAAILLVFAFFSPWVFSPEELTRNRSSISEESTKSVAESQPSDTMVDQLRTSPAMPVPNPDSRPSMTFSAQRENAPTRPASQFSNDPNAAGSGLVADAGGYNSADGRLSVLPSPTVAASPGSITPNNRQPSSHPIDSPAPAVVHFEESNGILVESVAGIVEVTADHSDQVTLEIRPVDAADGIVPPPPPVLAYGITGESGVALAGSEVQWGTRLSEPGEPTTGAGNVDPAHFFDEEARGGYGRGRRFTVPAPQPDPQRPEPFQTESYGRLVDNDFRTIAQPGDERSTFSLDVDTASYANVRRYLTQQQLPPKDAVRIEELINYFPYDYPAPAQAETPFAVYLETNEAPWTPGHRLLRIGLKARDVAVDQRPPSNLVFLLDVSGSMSSYDKLPLVKKVMRELVRGLEASDSIALVVYAGSSGVVLKPTPGDQKNVILAALDQLAAGGSTNGDAGIRLAYQLATERFIEGGVNRVILATDGDFNVGVTNTDELVAFASREAQEKKIFLTILGFGEGNLKEDRMEQIANKCNGAYHYIDSEREGRKVLVDQMSATLVTVAKDVKVQVEFNPAKVKSYRLIGYANRLLANRDFTDDTKDAGDVGAGHTVTAFYEIVPKQAGVPGPGEEPLRYRTRSPAPTEEALATDPERAHELVMVRLRYKDPHGEESKQLEFSLADEPKRWSDASEDFRFASAVAGYGMVLRDSPHRGTATFREMLRLAKDASSRDEFGLRTEFLALLETAARLRGEGAPGTR